jgi:hypothetical protein
MTVKNGRYCSTAPARLPALHEALSRRPTTGAEQCLLLRGRADMTRTFGHVAF